LNGNSIETTITKWFKSLIDTKIQIKRNTPYVITPSFNKRVKKFDSNGVWVNTSPWLPS